MAQTASGDSQTRDSFTSRTAFIIACIGSAVGLSGIWLFPYRVSQLGGAAFLIPYLFFVVLLGLTGVVGEMSFGRAMGCGPMGAFGKALELRGVSHATRIGKAIGIVPVLAALGIAIGYTVVLGWLLNYILAAANRNAARPTGPGRVLRSDHRRFRKHRLARRGAHHHASRYDLGYLTRH